MWSGLHLQTRHINSLELVCMSQGASRRFHNTCDCLVAHQGDDTMFCGRTERTMAHFSEQMQVRQGKNANLNGK